MEQGFKAMYLNDFVVVLIFLQWCQEQTLPYCGSDDGLHKFEATGSTIK